MLTDFDKEILDEVVAIAPRLSQNLESFHFREALREAMMIARIGNKYLAETEPWKVAKSDMERVATILHVALQITANLTIAFAPFLPFSTEKLLRMLQTIPFEWAQLGTSSLLAEGHTIGEAELLFEKIEDSSIEQQIQRLQNIKKANEASLRKALPIAENTSFDEFVKMDLRVGRVLACERVPKSDKLLRFQIDDGLQGRTILSGIAKFYQPEELLGKNICFIANLPPRKMMGITSEDDTLCRRL